QGRPRPAAALQQSRQEVHRGLPPARALHVQHPPPLLDQRRDRLELAVVEGGVGAPGEGVQRLERLVLQGGGSGVHVPSVHVGPTPGGGGPTCSGQEPAGSSPSASAASRRRSRSEVDSPSRSGSSLVASARRIRASSSWASRSSGSSAGRSLSSGSCAW